MIDQLIGNQSVIISLDVDNYLLDKVGQIAAAGFNLIEINSTDPSLLEKIIGLHPQIIVGAGGIITPEELEHCYQAGVHFASSPGFLPAVANTANIYSMNYLPGVATLSEAMAAFSIGCKQVKPLPATLPFCTLLSRYMPQLKLFPAEIAWEEAEHFLNLPSITAVGIINPDKTQISALSASLLV